MDQVPTSDVLDGESHSTSETVEAPGSLVDPTIIGMQSLEMRSDAERLRDVFRYDGDQIHLDITDFKSKGKLDRAKRLTFVYLYAHELEGRQGVKREDLKKLLDELSLWDANYRKWLSEEATLAKDATSGTIRLRVPARESARAILGQLFDPNYVGSTLARSSSRRRSRKSTEHKETDGIETPIRRRSGGRPKTVNAWLAAWEAKRSALGLNSDDIHKALAAAELADKGIVGMWAICEATEEPKKNVARGPLSEFLLTAFQIAEDEKRLERALKKPSVRDKVLNLKGTTFQLLPPGVDRALELLMPVPARSKRSGKGGGLSQP